jgi:hypothetical protein
MHAAREPDPGKLVAGSKSAFSILDVCFGATAMSLEGRLRPVRGPATRMGNVGQNRSSELFR